MPKPLLWLPPVSSSERPLTLTRHPAARLKAEARRTEAAFSAGMSSQFLPAQPPSAPAQDKLGTFCESTDHCYIMARPLSHPWHPLSRPHFYSFPIFTNLRIFRFRQHFVVHGCSEACPLNGLKPGSSAQASHDLGLLPHEGPSLVGPLGCLPSR